MKKYKDFILNTARDVVELEARSLSELVTYIDDSFVEVVELFNKSKGRIIVSGVGKSAIIARKIVATFNSTGTVASFMHSADAAHGDLGLIQKDDVVMFISKSGNTPEIKRLIPFIKEIGNMIVVMVANKESYIALHADHVLFTPVEMEACHNNLAPTTSTTVQLAMGDALAVALSKLKDFTTADFAKHHPGGILGRKLYIKVEDILDRKNKPLVNKNESIPNTIITISSHRLGAAVVLGDNEELLGIITDGDVRRMVERQDDYKSTIAEDIMSINPKTIKVGELAIEAFNIMEANKITSVVVLDNDIYVGLIHIHDVIKEGIC